MKVRTLPPDALKRGYSDDEVTQIYELARLYLENGEVRKAEKILNGLVEVAPDFAPGWLASSYAHLQSKRPEEAAFAARQALRAQPESPVGMLYLVICMLALEDYNTAGTYLGELRDQIDNGMIDDQNLVRLYRAQLARFQHR